ncbi:L-rhamnose mutarotase [Pararhizobium sp. IMCC21322]|uniref:L-rhamnose mutarotase n=1 Tax=Pararhizobium sp. IMCC21322 TaxID=3067903 RepID=UPI002741A911|nr:L-rhamnose mutarotase [Pararhizobium sp. IMCC21322]
MTDYRQAWRMRLRGGSEAAYDRAHAQVWPELIAEMRAAGVETFAIYRYGPEVFAFQQRKTPFPGVDIEPTQTMLRWWRMMEPLMISDNEGRPVRDMLSEVFVLDRERTHR